MASCSLLAEAMLPVLTLPSELQALFVGLLSDATIGRLAQTSRAGRQLSAGPAASRRASSLGGAGSLASHLEPRCCSTRCTGQTARRAHLARVAVSAPVEVLSKHLAEHPGDELSIVHGQLWCGLCLCNISSGKQACEVHCLSPRHLMNKATF